MEVDCCCGLLLIGTAFKYYIPFGFTLSSFFMERQICSWVRLSNYAFKLWTEQKGFPKVLMGFDVGSKSTGVAISSSDLRHTFVDLLVCSI